MNLSLSLQSISVRLNLKNTTRMFYIKARPLLPASSLLIPHNGKAVPHMIVLKAPLSVLLHLDPSCPHPLRLTPSVLYLSSDKEGHRLVRVCNDFLL